MKKLITIIFLAMFPFNCGFMNIAHRGDNEQGKYAEHSFAAYDRAVCAQVDYLELDLQESSDHVLVVSHDDNLSRVFGVDEAIEKNNFKKLTNYRNQSGESIHSLEEVFQRQQNNPQVKFMLELKGDGEDAKRIVELLNKYHLQKRILFESFSSAALKKLARLVPKIPRTQLAGSYKATGHSQDFAASFYTADAANYLHDKNKKYMLWGVNSNKQMHKFLNPDKGVTGLLTDFPVRLAKILQENNHFRIYYQPVTFPTENLAANLKLNNGHQVKADQVKLVNNRLWYHVQPNMWLNEQNLAHHDSLAPRAQVGLVKVDQATPVWTDLYFKKSAGKTLRAHSHWNQFAVAKYHGKRVYNLGGNQWIK